MARESQFLEGTPAGGPSGMVATHESKGPVSPDAQMARSAPLLREILLEAWTIGRTMPRALNLLFGMASEVTATILQLTASLPSVIYDGATYSCHRFTSIGRDSEPRA
jgi:hypothetical protein